MNESKKISKEETDIRLVGSQLESLLLIFSRVHAGSIPASEKTKNNVKETIKDYCDTIVKYVDLF